MKSASPLTSMVPLFMTRPRFAVTFRSPPIMLAARFTSVAFTIVALPRIPFVVSAMEPSTASIRSMTASPAMVVKSAVPPTVTVLLLTRSPVSSITSRLLVAPRPVEDSSVVAVSASVVAVSVSVVESIDAMLK